jgi:hypothetical protein
VPVRKQKIPKYFKEQKVLAKYRGRGRWYTARIAKVRNDDAYDIDYDDGEKETDVERVLIRLPVPEDIDISEPFSVQMKRAAMCLSTNYVNESFPSCTVILKRSNIMYRNSSMKLMSETLRADETMRAPIVHAFVWVRGSMLGFVIYDMELEQVHTLQQKSPQAQAVSIAYYHNFVLYANEEYISIL